jgi:hypothetical protein
MNNPTIVRLRSEDPYCRVPNQTLQDPKLSFKAKGILAYLLSKPQGWLPRLRDLENNSVDGPGTIKSGLKELRENNYAELQKLVKNGKIICWRLVISDSRSFHSNGAQVSKTPEGQNPEVEIPEVEIPEVSFPLLENQPHSNTDCSKTDCSKTEKTVVGSPKEKAADTKAADFETFWAAYPNKKGKGKARLSFYKVLTPLETLLACVKVHSQSEQWRKDGGRFIPHPATWLNQERWLDEQIRIGEAAVNVEKEVLEKQERAVHDLIEDEIDFEKRKVLFKELTRLEQAIKALN